MNPEALAKMLPRGIDPVSVGRSTARGALNTVELAGSLAGLKGYEENLIRAKYLQDVGSREWFGGFWDRYVVMFSTREEWRITDARRRLFSGFTYRHWLDPNLCDWCGGTGIDITPGTPVECQRCHGTGREQKDRSAQRLAEHLGLKRLTNEWSARKTWADRTLNTIEQVALSKIG